MKHRIPPQERKAQLLGIAVDMAKRVGYTKVTKAAVAAKAGVTPPMINHHFSTMVQLKRDIMRVAVQQAIPEIVAQGLAVGDARAKRAPEALKQAAAALMIA